MLSARPELLQRFAHGENIDHRIRDVRGVRQRHHFAAAQSQLNVAPSVYFQSAGANAANRWSISRVSLSH